MHSYAGMCMYVVLFSWVTDYFFISHFTIYISLAPTHFWISCFLLVFFLGGERKGVWVGRGRGVGGESEVGGEGRSVWCA